MTTPHLPALLGACALLGLGLVSSCRNAAPRPSSAS